MTRADHRSGGFDVGFGQLEHQLVMHLQQHPNPGQGGRGQRRLHAHHRALDDIRARPLDRRIDRRAFGPASLVRVLRVDTREPCLAAEQRLRIAPLAHALQRLVNIGADAGEAVEIAVDHVLRLVRIGAEPPGEPPAADAVEDREIDRLGPRTRVAVDRAEHLARGAVVNVLACRERLLQRGDVGHVRREAELDLRIVGGEENVAFLRHEGLADAVARSRCGSGCSGGWGRSRRGARSARRPASSWCAHAPFAD